VSGYLKIAYRIDSGIARIALNRPERRNALDQELLSEFRAALGVSAADESVRVIVVSGAGKDFCSGMDLRTFADNASGEIAKFQAEARNMAGLLLDMRRHPRPIVAAVQGRALINRVFGAETLEREVEEFVMNLASNSSSALAMSKELFYRTDAMQFEAAIEAGAEVNAFARTTEDFKRGIQKFVKKT
jgi:enoyl-CoA hydratase/carnithine racemase